MHREREMQRLELARLRKLLMKHSGQGMASVPSLNASFPLLTMVPPGMGAAALGGRGGGGATHVIPGVGSSHYARGPGGGDPTGMGAYPGPASDGQVGWADGFFVEAGGAGDDGEMSLTGSSVNKEGRGQPAAGGKRGSGGVLRKGGAGLRGRQGKAHHEGGETDD